MVVELLEKIRARVQRPKESTVAADGDVAPDAGGGCLKRKKAKKGAKEPQSNDAKARADACALIAASGRRFSPAPWACSQSQSSDLNHSVCDPPPVSVCSHRS